MAYDEHLADRTRKAFRELHTISVEEKMMGDLRKSQVDRHV